MREFTVRRLRNGHYELSLVATNVDDTLVFVRQTFPTYMAMNVWLEANGYAMDRTKRSIV